MLLELSVSDASIWSVTLESSIMFLEALFTLLYDVYSTGVSNDDLYIFKYWPLVSKNALGSRAFSAFSHIRQKRISSKSHFEIGRVNGA